MNLERITTTQFIGNFTAANWVAILTVIFAIISSTAGGAFWVGQKLAEAQSFALQAELESNIYQLQAKLEVMQSRVEAITNSNAQWRDAHQKIQDVLKQKNVEIAQLSMQLGRVNNCTFIHEQILQIVAEIENTGNMSLLDTSKEWEERQIARRSILEKRLEGYQQQIGLCNK
jgi:hypothetical protein